MAKRMLIDTSHPEETRVVVQSGNRVEEFDFETASRKPLKGNIYLARVTRVEPSLQAAFVEYGGNRHGFLAFSEIHPDYWQIPVADRQALLEMEAAEEAAAAAEEEAEAAAEAAEAAATASSDETAPGSPDDPEGAASDAAAPAASTAEAEAEAVPAPSLAQHAPRLVEQDNAEPAAATEAGEAPGHVEQVETFHVVETLGGDVPSLDSEYHEHDAPEGGLPADATGDMSAEFDGEAETEETGEREGGERRGPPRRRRFPMRPYKIQEVIKRRQILLVQVVKEERGTKGAALTTYLSLAGRYCVLMPNTSRGGGISRKIVSPTDRKRLKAIVTELDVPQGMGVILRTAGLDRSKPEIRRDFEYLLRLWDNIRELTLQSTAPCLIYEEGDLIKRAIRDYYSSDIEEILVEGEAGYRTARDFIGMLMPSHASRVKLYRERVSLFQRHQIEAQVDAMYNPTVNLRSGGYIVINPTEALVAIDVNSGRSTREHNIEETAYKTNLEAAEEVARQLRLRDLAGLIVVDFIDMGDPRNNRHVERRMKDCLKNDRARIQVGRISPFGLLEMSRQRLRPSLIESSTQTCPHCAGRGYIRSVESSALHVLRAIEDEAMKERASELNVRVSTSIALYIFNRKREVLIDIEARYGVAVSIEGDDSLIAPDHRIDRVRGRVAQTETARPISAESIRPRDLEIEAEPEAEAEAEAESEEIEATAEAAESQAESAGADGDRRRRRRRRRRDGDRRPLPQPSAGAAGDETEPQNVEAEAADAGEMEAEAPADAAAADSEAAERRKRRGRRGGRRRRHGDRRGLPMGEDAAADEATDGAPAFAGEAETPPPEPWTETPPAYDGHPGEPAVSAREAEMTPLPESAPEPWTPPEPAPERRAEVAPPSTIAVPEPAPVAAAAPEPVVAEPAPAAEEEVPPAARRRGWWSRGSLFGGR
ncbi:Rne/Rng family ribonuclease [Desertibaculum subflavum]|uniref:Rne/Rng family ribonuclease n=1 Tax=Desertibaculum subflavum TaxID=2268458 RepID=UPI000E666DB6